MSEKEIISLLSEEQKLEEELTKAKVKAEKIPVKSLEEAKVEAETLQKGVESEIMELQNSLEKETNLRCQKIKERTEKKIQIIQSCHASVGTLAKKTMRELLGELIE